MFNKEFGEQKALLREFNIPECILKKYNEHHRFNHNQNHINDLWIKGSKMITKHDIGVPYDLGLAIIFHDIIYDPKSKDNEKKSAEFLMSFAKNDKFPTSRYDIFIRAYNAILDTENHEPKTELGKVLCEIDVSSLHEDFDVLLKNEELIAKEYQYLPYEKYVSGRINFLIEFYKNNIDLGKVFNSYISFVKNKKPNIGLYAGTFNPFHKGHLNILEKAEKIFDKVIILYGNNTAKDNSITKIVPKYIENREIVHHSGLLVDYINSLPYDVTLIRGLRNTTDLQAELNLYRFLNDMKPDIKIINIFCDAECEHISSSSLKEIEKFTSIKNYIVE